MWLLLACYHFCVSATSVLHSPFYIQQNIPCLSVCLSLAAVPSVLLPVAYILVLDGWIQPNKGESARGFPRNQLIRECAAENAAWVLLLLEHFLLFFTARVLCISTAPGEKSVIILAFAVIRSHVFRPFLSPNSLLFLCRVMSLSRTGVFAFLF